MNPFQYQRIIYKTYYFQMIPVTYDVSGIPIWHIWNSNHVINAVNHYGADWYIHDTVKLRILE